MDWKRTIICAAILGALSLPAVALNATTTTGNTKTPRINKRQRHQQKRIHQGVQSGELTQHETRRLEKEQAKIQHDKVQAKSDGTVTPKERAKLTREQNKASRDIYRQKHDNQTQTK